MSEQQQSEPGIGIQNSFGINTLIGSLMDVQQVLRVIPSMQARIDALTKSEAELKAKLEDAEARLAALAPRVVEASDA